MIVYDVYLTPFNFFRQKCVSVLRLRRIELPGQLKILKLLFLFVHSFRGKLVEKEEEKKPPLRSILLNFMLVLLTLKPFENFYLQQICVQ